MCLDKSPKLLVVFSFVRRDDQKAYLCLCAVMKTGWDAGEWETL